MPKSFHAVDSSTRVYFQAASNKINQLRITLKNISYFFQPNHILDVFDSIPIYVPISEQFFQGWVLSFLDHPIWILPTILLNHS